MESYNFAIKNFKLGRAADLYRGRKKKKKKKKEKMEERIGRLFALQIVENRKIDSTWDRIGSTIRYSIINSLINSAY